MSSGKKNSEFHVFLCVRSKSLILRITNVSKKFTDPKAAKFATLLHGLLACIVLICSNNTKNKDNLIDCHDEKYFL